MFGYVGGLQFHNWFQFGCFPSQLIEARTFLISLLADGQSCKKRALWSLWQEWNDIVASLKNVRVSTSLIGSPTWTPINLVRSSKVGYDHHVKLCRLLNLPAELILESLRSVQSSIVVVKLSTTLQCEEIIRCCVKYLEGVHREHKEDEHILRSHQNLARQPCP